MELNVLTCADILGTTASRSLLLKGLNVLRCRADISGTIVTRSLLLKGLNVPRCQADILGRIANGAEITRAIICG